MTHDIGTIDGIHCIVSTIINKTKQCFSCKLLHVRRCVTNNDSMVALFYNHAAAT